MRRLRVIPTVTLLLLASWLGAASAERIESLHCNGPRGESVALGKTVTVTGVVTAQFSTGKNARLYVQDPSGGVCVYGSPKNCAALGDSVRVTGRVATFGGLTQITGDSLARLQIEALGKSTRAMVAFALTPMDARTSQQSDGCEPNESRLVLVHDVLVRALDGSLPATGAKFTSDTNYRLAHAAADSATNWVLMRVVATTACDASRTLVGQPVPVTPVQVTGVLSQYVSRSTRDTGYQILPRTRGDVQTGVGDYRENVPNR